MQNNQMIGQQSESSTEQATTTEKVQLQQQQPITSQQPEMQQYANWFPYQMPMMPMPQMFGSNQFFGQSMKQNQGDFFVRKSKEEQQLQNQQYQQMFDPQFGFTQFMAMPPFQGQMPNMPFPFFPMMPSMPTFKKEDEQEDEQQEEENNIEMKDDEKKENRTKQERPGRQQQYKYQKKQYRPKQGRYQGVQQDQQKVRTSKQQNKQRVRIDSDSFPALPVIYQKKEVQDSSAKKEDKEVQKQQNENNKENNFTEPKIFYSSAEIQKIFFEFKLAKSIKMNENLIKLDKADLPIVLPEGCLQLEIVEPTKVTKRKEEKTGFYHDKELSSKRKNTFDNYNVMSRHKCSLQITTYEKKEIK